MTGAAVSESLELLLRILADVRPPVPAEAAYLFGQTEPNQKSVFAAARELLQHSLTSRIWISDCTPRSGYVGAAACRRALVEFGIPAEAIEEVPMEPTGILHTLIESAGVVRFARRWGYQRLIVTSSPFHQERAFMTAVTAALREYPALKIYSYPGEPQPWDEIVTHSQGKLTGTRAQLIAEEQKRIEKYAAQGDLAPRREILKYLHTRD
jgi:uncharacterized SAM-binding protein YcdF (DUF218 family)